MDRNLNGREGVAVGKGINCTKHHLFQMCLNMRQWIGTHDIFFAVFKKNHLHREIVFTKHREQNEEALPRMLNRMPSSTPHTGSSMASSLPPLLHRAAQGVTERGS